MNIGRQQIKIINKSKSYIKKINKLGIDTGKSVLCYFAGWDETLGLCKLRLWIGEFDYINYFKLFLKEIWGIYNQNGYVVKNVSKLDNFTKLIITWGYRKNFLFNGSLQDNYFQTNSREIKNSIWFVIYFDENLPKKVDKNIIILKKEKRFNYNFLPFLQVIFKIFIENKMHIKKILHYMSSNSIFGQIILEKIENHIKEKNLRTIIMPYEAQPFQQMIFSYAKKINRTIKTIGYVHDAEPLHLHYQFRKGSPDLLLFHAKSRRKYFVKFLNWPKNRIKFIPSLSFRKGANKEISNGAVLLPNGLYHRKKIITEFETFLQFSKTKSLSKLRIRCHPRSFNLNLQKEVKAQLEALILQYKNKFSNKPVRKKMIVVIGVSSAVILALEKGMEAFQICTEPIIQSYSPEIWPDIHVSQLSPNIFRYRLKKFGKCITFGNEKNMFKKYCTN